MGEIDSVDIFIQIWDSEILSHGVRIWMNGDNKIEYLSNNSIALFTYNSSNISFGINIYINYSCAINNDGDDGIFNSHLCETGIFNQDKD